VAAAVRGFQGEGVAAAAEHFPGAGDADPDLPGEPSIVPHGLGRLSEVELEPFRAAVQAGVSAVTVANAAVPVVTGRADLPSSLSRIVLGDLLREGLRYDGVVLAELGAPGPLGDGSDRVVEAIAALRAGVDLLLLPGEVASERRLLEALARANANEVFDRGELATSHARIAGLRRRLALRTAAGLDAVGCGEHRSLAEELAARSVTMVRNGAGLIPLRTDVGRIAVVTVAPPEDSVEGVDRGDLASALGSQRDRVEGFVTTNPPVGAEIADLRERLHDVDLIVVGTTDASRDPRQAALVAALHEAGPPVLWVAVSGPWDLLVFPHAPTYVCTYGPGRSSLAALAGAICGIAPFRGRLPVALGGLHPRGHGLSGDDPGVA
jgi:beta-N-acetylhexosaminidase